MTCKYATYIAVKGNVTNQDDHISDVESYQDSTFSKGILIAVEGSDTDTPANLIEIPVATTFIEGIPMSHILTQVDDDPDNHWVAEGDEVVDPTDMVTLVAFDCG